MERVYEEVMFHVPRFKPGHFLQTSSAGPAKMELYHLMNCQKKPEKTWASDIQDDLQMTGRNHERKYTVRACNIFLLLSLGYTSTPRKLLRSYQYDWSALLKWKIALNYGLSPCSAASFVVQYDFNLVAYELFQARIFDSYSFCQRQRNPQSDLCDS
jgi:hypothetical protein